MGNDFDEAQAAAIEIGKRENRAMVISETELLLMLLLTISTLEKPLFCVCFWLRFSCLIVS